MANHLSGALRLFFGKTNFTAAQIDSAYGSRQIACHTTGLNPVSWLQAHTLGQVKISRNGEMLDLKDDMVGLTDIVISDSDTIEIEFSIADHSAAMIFNLLGLDPTAALNFDTSATGVGGKLDYSGTSMLANGFPVLLYAKKYDGGNTTNVPKFGTGSDGYAWCLFKMCLSGRQFEEVRDAKNQLVYNIKLKAVAVDGAVNTGVAFCKGALTALV